MEAALTAGKHVLSEKPIAENVDRAKKLIEFYSSEMVKEGATWAVAENYRFLESFAYGTLEVRKLGRLVVTHLLLDSDSFYGLCCLDELTSGRVLDFRVKSFLLVTPGDRYFGKQHISCQWNRV